MKAHLWGGPLDDTVLEVPDGQQVVQVVGDPGPFVGFIPPGGVPPDQPRQATGNYVRANFNAEDTARYEAVFHDVEFEWEGWQE